MKRSCLAILAAGLFLLGGVVWAEKPVVIVDKKARFDIYVAPISGANGSQATKVLEDDLKMSGSFNLVGPGQAAFVANGMLSNTGMTGSLAPKGQGPMWSRRFDGDWRRATHLFADAIVEAVTQAKGIASTRVVFVSKSTGAKEIYVMDIDGANLRQLSNDKTISLGPKWSYDGKRIAYMSYKSSFPDVWMIDLDTLKRKRVSHYAGFNGQPAFSPDGKELAVVLSKEGNTELYTLDAEGGSPTRLTRTRGTEASPVWSPDGSKIAYVSDDRGTPQVYLMPSKGGAPTRVRTNSSYTTEPDWSPDGKKLAYAIMSGGQNQIVMTDLETGQQTVLTESGDNEQPSWTRDSRHIVYARGGEFYLLDSLTKQSLHIRNGLSHNSEPNCTK